MDDQRARTDQVSAERAWFLHRPLVEEALLGVDAAGRYDFVVASGGRVSGLYHAHSDVDLYAVMRSPAAGDVDTEDEVEVVVDGVVVQISQLSHGLVGLVIERLGSYRISRADRGQVEDFELYGKLASRLVTGRVVRTSPEGTRMLGGLSAEALRRVGVSAHGLFVARMLEDAAGAVALGDADIGLQAAALGLDAAVNCLLFGLGDLHWGDALLWRRVAAHPELGETAAAARGALARLYGAGADVGQVLAEVRSVCRTASVLASVAAVGADGEGCDLRLLRAVEAPAVQDREFEVAVSFSDGLSVLAPRTRTDTTGAQACRRLLLTSG